MSPFAPYPHFPSRRIHDLDGIWDAAFLGSDVDLAAVDVTTISWDDRLPVPGCFDASPRYAGKRGVMAYRCGLAVTPGQAGRLRFGGMGLRCRVLVDGQEVGACGLPYSGFSLSVPAAEQPCREVLVLVDNRFDDDGMPLFRQFYDFYAYGGLYRSVSWHEVGDWSIDRVQVRCLDAAAGAVGLKIRLDGTVPESVSVSVGFDHGELVDRGPQSVQGACIDLQATVPEARLWTPDDPQLHTLRLQIGEEEIVERFGLRSVATRGREILLNGEPIKLVGYNRHEVHPQTGPALPYTQLVDDLQHLRELGCNFIRGSHYPQDQRFLDLCDELGFIVWEEALGWGYAEEQWARPGFLPDNVAQCERMVQNSFNHPSIIMWGYLNEGASHLIEYEEIYTTLADVIRAADDSRLVTYATNRIFEGVGDQFLGLVDVVAMNTYPGWYARSNPNSRPLEEIVPALRKSQEMIAAHGGGDKPLIVSEIGAGAIYGWRDPHHAHWSEEYQSDLIEVVCQEVVQGDAYAGLSLWQFCDCRTYDSSHALGRPRAFNNKGTLDEYRRPKLAYGLVQRYFKPVTGR